MQEVHPSTAFNRTYLEKHALQKYCQYLIGILNLQLLAALTELSEAHFEELLSYA